MMAYRIAAMAYLQDIADFFESEGSSSVSQEINPKIDGAGKYPNRLQQRLAREFAVDLCYQLTEFIIIPVTGGKQNPPANKRNQSKTRNTGNEFRNGIGNATNAAIILIKH